MSFPEGHYNEVSVVDPLSGEQLLNHGTGTSSSIKVFACGMFQRDTYPKIGQRYKIVAYQGQTRHEDAIACITSGHQTCEFKE